MWNEESARSAGCHPQIREATMGGTRMEEISADLGFELDDPRIVAAMRVTGITLYDLELPIPDTKDLPPAEQDRQQRRYDCLHLKRQALVRELQTAAQALDDSYVEAILSPRVEEPVNTRQLQATLKKEKEKAEKQRMWIRQQLQRRLEADLAKAQDQHGGGGSAGSGGKADHASLEELKRMKELREEKETKKAEALVQARSREQEQRLGCAKKLREQSDRVSSCLGIKEESRQAALEERHKKMADIADRSLRHTLQFQERQRQRYEEIIAKDHKLAEKRDQKQEDAAMNQHEQQNKFSNKQDVVKEALLKQEQRREEMYHEARAKQAKTAEEREARNKEIMEKSSEKRQKDLDRLQAKQESNKLERRAWVKQIKDNILSGSLTSRQVREKQLTTKQAGAPLQAEIYSEVVRRNRDRIERSDAWGREQTLNRIQQTNARIDTLLDERKAIVHYRLETQKDLMIGKDKLILMKRTMGDSPSAKQVNQILKELDLPALVETVAKDGDDVEEKK